MNSIDMRSQTIQTAVYAAPSNNNNRSAKHQAYIGDISCNYVEEADFGDIAVIFGEKLSQNPRATHNSSSVGARYQNNNLMTTSHKDNKKQTRGQSVIDVYQKNNTLLT